MKQRIRKALLLYVVHAFILSAAGAASAQQNPAIEHSENPGDFSQSTPQPAPRRLTGVQGDPGGNLLDVPPVEDGQLVNSGWTNPGNGNLSPPAEADSASGWDFQHWSTLVLLGLAIALGAIGLVLGLALFWRRRGGVRSALGASIPPGSVSQHSEQHLDQQVSLLAGHVGRMRERIAQLELDVQRLTRDRDLVEQQAETSPAAPQSPQRNVGFFETSRIVTRQVSDPDVDLAAPPEIHRGMENPTASRPRIYREDGAGIAEIARSQEFREMLDEYNSAASQGDRQAIAQFERRYSPQAVTAVGDGATLVRGSDDLLWFLPLQYSGIGLVVPGPGPIKNWHKVYRTMLGQQAKERFGTLYEVREGAELTVESPAWAKEVDGAFERLRPGVLRGALRA